MTLDQIADEAHLRLHELADGINNLERAIISGRSKIPAAEVQKRRRRLHDFTNVARALRICADNKNRLPKDLIKEIEA